MSDSTRRAQILRSFGAGPDDTIELLHYNENVFRDRVAATTFPLPDEPFIKSWEQYAREVEAAGSILPLAKYLIQLCFPICEGISATEDYIAATRRGRPADELPSATGLPLCSPERCRVVIHSTPAGRIPLLIASDRRDFVALVRALSKRNEPCEIPDSMGASMIAGYNNWARFHAAASALPPSKSADAFQKIASQKDLYQDRFIILSDGPYSGVSASELGLDGPSWHQTSLLIRREHECAHYFTRRIFSSMRNNLLDEFIADYCGITAASGRFRADWLLRFLGLESFPLYRKGGRLQNYRGDPPLSDGAFAILGRLVCQAARNVEQFEANRPRPGDREQDHVAMVLTLAGMTLEQLASTESLHLLEERWTNCLGTLAGQGVH